MRLELEGVGSDVAWIRFVPRRVLRTMRGAGLRTFSRVREVVIALTRGS